MQLFVQEKIAENGKMSFRIKYFLVYNPTFGPEEGQEHEKLIYFYPLEITTECERVRIAGLAEALHKFAQTFTDEPLKVMNTTLLLYIFFYPEPNYFMAIVVEKPSTVEHACIPHSRSFSGTLAAHSSNEERTTSEVPRTPSEAASPPTITALRTSRSHPALEHAHASPSTKAENLPSAVKRPQNLSSSSISASQPPASASFDLFHMPSVQNACHTLLRYAYHTYVLFMNRFDSNVATSSSHANHRKSSKTDGKNILQAKCRKFFNNYMPLLESALGFSATGCLLERFNGISYLSLDEAGFLQVNCFVNHLQLMYAEKFGLRHCVFLFHDYLIFSDLENMDDNKLLYSYMTKIMLPAYYADLCEPILSYNNNDTAELNGSADDPSNRNGNNENLRRRPHYGKFINIPLNFASTSDGSLSDSVFDAAAVTRVFLRRKTVTTDEHEEFDESADNKCRYKQHIMLVYQEGNCVLLLFLDDSLDLTTKILDELDDAIALQLPSIDSILTETNAGAAGGTVRSANVSGALPISSTTSITPTSMIRLPTLMPSLTSSTQLIGSSGGSMEPPYLRFIYLNDVNYAKKQNLIDGTTPPLPVMQAVLAFLAEMDDELRRLPTQAMPSRLKNSIFDANGTIEGGNQLMNAHSDIELTARPCDDYWLVARRSEQRYIFVVMLSNIILGANSSNKSGDAPDLLEVDATARKLSKLPHVFFA